MIQDFVPDGTAVGMPEPDRAGTMLASAMKDRTPRKLASRQKAAVIVRLLLSQGVSPGLDRLSAAQQAQLARAMGTLGQIDRVTLSHVIHEFTGRLDTLALTFPRGLSDALNLLEPHLSPIARDGLRAEAAAGDDTDPWSRILSLDPARLRPLLDSESAEVAAILLSKLPVAKAAALLSDLPPERALVIAHSVAMTATVTPDMVGRIGHHLDAILSDIAPRAFAKTAVDRVGAILNATSQAARDQVLEGLGTRDARFAADVRRAIFTFAHLPARLEPGDVPRVLRRVDPAIVPTALAAGLVHHPVSVEFLLENMSRRLAEQLRDEAEGKGLPKEAEGDAAMAAIIATIRELEEAGEIRLIPPTD